MTSRIFHERADRAGMFNVLRTRGGAFRKPYKHETWRRLLHYTELVDNPPPPRTVVIGVSHTTAVHESGIVHTWGFDPGDGRMGQGDEGVNRFSEWDGGTPKGIRNLYAKVVTVSTGPSHGLAVTDTGDAYSWGAGVGDMALGGKGGKLGHGDREDIFEAKLIEHLREENEFIIACAAGSDHSVLLTDEGRVYSTGGGTFGEHGHGIEEVLTPRLIELTTRISMREIAAGDFHTVVLADNGQVYTCGCNQRTNQRGQLGHGDYGHRTELTLVQHVAHLEVCRIAAGGSHTAIITTDGLLWCCGDDSHGQCGQGLSPIPMRRDELAIGGNNPTVALPSAVTLLGYNCVTAAVEPRDERVVMAACGSHHTLALTFDGLIYSFGANSHGCLGRNVKAGEKYEVPRALPDLRGYKVVQIAAGGFTCTAVTCEGQVFTWGHGAVGQLGRGSFTDSRLPQLVAGLTCEPTESHVVPLYSVSRPDSDPADGRKAPAI